MIQITHNTTQRIQSMFMLAVLCVCACLLPLSAHAFFGDKESSEENGFSASSLDMELDADPDDDKNIVEVNNVGGTPFTYTVRVDVQDNEFCEDVEVKFGTSSAQSATLAVPIETTLAPGESVEHEFAFEYDENDHPGATCVVKYVYEAHQDGYDHGEAFFDTETDVVILSGADIEDPVINEVYPDPDDTVGEWVEIYNPNGFEIDLAGWKITEEKNGSTTAYTIVAAAAPPSEPSEVRTESGETQIPADGYLVVLFDTSSKLNNDGDTVILQKPDGTQVDSFTFSDSTTAKSAGLFPDGTDSILNPIDPTKGMENTSTYTPPPTS